VETPSVLSGLGLTAVLLASPATVDAYGTPRQLDAPLPPRPAATYGAHSVVRDREIGTPTTLFVNFDGVTLGDCQPSNSKENCTWYNQGAEILPFSGTMQTKVSVLQAMRRAAADYGIRITGVRPDDDEDYTMVIYGGTEAQFGVLGSAPSGDCFDQLPNQIAFAHVDGELNEWINGGANTALHEAAHSWGLDHISVDTGIMYPTGNNLPTGYRRTCDPVVEDVDLTLADASCWELSNMLCGAPDVQNAGATLDMLFGPPYVDTTAPTLTLVEPEDGQYFQAPASFDVVFDIDDDLHPQLYEMRAWLGDDAPPPMGSPTVEPGFALEDLPIGTWEIHVEIVDDAGNPARLDFTVEVGADPPPVEEPDDEGACACRGATEGVSGGAWFVVFAAGLARRRRRR
jgi:hypothetical protein